MKSLSAAWRIRIAPLSLILVLTPGWAAELTSRAFRSGEDIPTQFSCRGMDRSPPLEWSGIPEGTKSLALICADPDAPAGVWVHWVIFNIPPSTAALDAGRPRNVIFAGDIRQGINDYGKIGYSGPCPPPGRPHRYVFTLYALNLRLDLAPGSSRSELLAGMKGHILSEASLIGRFQR